MYDFVLYNIPTNYLLSVHISITTTRNNKPHKLLSHKTK